MNRFKGISFAALSSSTFGLAPLFTLLLLGAGFSAFEVLSYRWGVASVALGLAGLLSGCRFRLNRGELGTVFCLSLLRATCSLSLVVAYSNISSGVASTIHFLYPLAVAATMMCFFGEKASWRTITAIGISLIGAMLLSSGEISSPGGNSATGITAAWISVFSYGGYIIGVRRSRAVEIDSVALAFYVMAFGALFFLLGGWATGGVRWVTTWLEWGWIAGLALPATAISNLALVKAIKYVGPTLTSIFGALEPLTAVAIGAVIFGERFGTSSAAGIVLVVAAVVLVVCQPTKRSVTKESAGISSQE